ncbi:ATP-binding protein [Sphingobacterium psychroaquaticum]|uniref:ATP-binding protein n=1 Tax=Sphingobacterium psychroaquaticum TaxID=561061 RepID=UPI001069640E|nr:ATP-binding protein [Sphingobacterium psychroaquaticum]QBQ41753.1 ATP-binding protein [Sphingobacterium psychroaquaticum]
MDSKSMEWVYTLEHHLTPKRLIENLEEKTNQSDVENRLETGISMFRPYFVERLGFSQKQAKTALVQLVIASDKIYDFLIESARYRGENKTTQNIRQRYLKILGQLESLLEDCGKIDCDVFYHIPLTLHSIVNVRLLLRQRLDILQRKIIITDIDGELSSLLVRGLQMLISKKGISRAEVSYTIAVMDSLKATDSLNTSVLEDLLCQLDFNTPTFFNYWINYCNKLLEDEPNLHRQKEILIGMEDRISDLEKVVDVTDERDDNAILSIISLKDVNIQMRKILPMVICKQIYEQKKAKIDRDKYLNIIIDEAHNILSYNSERESESWKDYRLETFEEIIKEGRKFGVFLTIASQRPSDISGTIISQLHNYMLHRLINNKDIEAVEKTISYLDKVSFDSLPILPRGSCILAGISAQLPVIIEVSSIPDENRPHNETMVLTKHWRGEPNLSDA